MDYVQTTPGRLEAKIHSVATRLVEVREASFRTAVLLTTDNAFPRFGVGINLSGQSDLFGSSLTDSNLGYTNGHNGVFARVQDASSWCNVSIDFELLERVAETHDYEIPSGDGTYGLPIDKQRSFVRMMSLVARAQRCSELSNAQLDDETALTVLRTLNPPQERGGMTRSKHYIKVQCVIEYIHAHYFESMTVTGLCQLVGFSERSLQYNFLDATGLTVQQYLMHYRLHRAHSLLIRGQVGQVKDAAQACGIPHTGRFSQYFKNLFGESPSQLLQPN